MLLNKGFRCWDVKSREGILLMKFGDLKKAAQNMGSVSQLQTIAGKQDQFAQKTPPHSNMCASGPALAVRDMGANPEDLQ